LLQSAKFGQRTGGSPGRKAAQVRYLFASARQDGFSCLGAQGDADARRESPGTRNRGATEMATKKKSSAKKIGKSANRSPKAKKASAAKRSTRKRSAGKSGKH
jgi:hypothetical protein